MEWSEGDIQCLKRLAIRYPRTLDKNERWRLVSKEMKRGKRECYEKYKELKKNKQQSIVEKEGEVNDVDELDGPVVVEESKRYDGDSFEEKVKSPKMLMEEIEDFDDDFNVFSQVPWKESKLETVSSRNSNNNSNNHESREFSSGEVKVIKKLLFGSRKPQVLDPSWSKQGFFFSKSRDLGYGLVQSKGGPCGILAVVQAFVLRELIFNKSITVGDWKNPTKEEQISALVSALTNIIWQASTGEDAYLCVCAAAETSNSNFNLEKMVVISVNSESGLHKLVSSRVALFMRKSGPGVAMLLCSLLVTRGLGLEDSSRSVSHDIDTALGDASTLIGNHNYAAQELVNLLLVGNASSNVFNGTQELESGSDDKPLLLRGIRRRGTVGFLTLYEHYEYMKVGSHLKSPHVPIWVICSESHYSVLFSDSQNLVERFDLFYFDPLGNQDQEYRLSVDADPSEPVEHDTSDSRLVSPIDDCIRTKWKGATVDWNGAEPLL